MTPTPTAEIVIIDDPLPPGRPVKVRGNLPPGLYRLCVVLNGQFGKGQNYNGETVVCSRITVPDGGGRAVLPETTVGTVSEPGEYDVLALTDPDGVIVAGDDLSEAPGLTVQLVLSSKPPHGLVLGALMVLLVLFRPRRRAARPSGTTRAR